MSDDPDSIRALLLAALHAPDPAVQTLVHAVRATCDDPAQTDDAKAAHIDLLIAQAYTHLARAGRAADDAALLFAWRRLHTDACILGALVSPPAAAIAKLDTAIILSGAAGDGRLDLVLALIQRIQAAHWPAPAPFDASPPPSQSHAVPPRTLPAPPIPARAPPSLAAFQAHAHTAPFILRGYAVPWPALTTRPWASRTYLRATAGPARLVPVEVGADYRAPDWSQRLVPFDAFLAALDADVTSGEAPLYLAQHDLLLQFPALRADIAVPDYVYADLPRPPGCAPPANPEQLVVNVWMGPKGTVSPAHTVRPLPFLSFFLQIAGHKTVWAAPPACRAALDAPPGGNTARVDVFAPDCAVYPKFAALVAGAGARVDGDRARVDGNATSGAMSATLAPGDVLYLPAGWWHAMRAEERSCSVSMWF
ncbi:hypothetical protein B0H17DRAFT_1004158 [Mycena rosella]|uniref:JmjC domain-containing protein n=1 Tax=Mycena rosella TaxID=1033263 RepID=A0AAD7GMN2_MYCRO|nr:hypothetical protein B0H17DRAFT_1004158 [Mycena rosella]